MASVGVRFLAAYSGELFRQRSDGSLGLEAVGYGAGVYPNYGDAVID